MNHPTDDDLVLMFYGETPDARDLSSHVEHCEGCRERLNVLDRTLSQVGQHAVPDPGPGYAAEVWARIEPRLEGPPRAGWLAWFAPRPLAFAAGVALLVIAAFVAGRHTAPTTAPPVREAVAGRPAGQPTPANTPEKVRDRVLLVAVGDHLERSQMVLVELMNSPEAASVDISAAQEWARDLVPTNRLIRQTATQTGEKGMADVLGDLERFLVEIANSPSRLSGPEFDQVRQRVEAQGLVFKIRVLDSQVRQREAPAPVKADRTRS